MSEQEIQELLNTVQKLTASVKELTEENARLRKKLDRMNELLLLAQQARFGQSSEKREYVLKGGEQMAHAGNPRSSPYAKAEAAAG